jgi:hypothetical protein
MVIHVWPHLRGAGAPRLAQFGAVAGGAENAV